MDSQHYIRIYDDVIMESSCKQFIDFFLTHSEPKKAEAPGAPEGHKRFLESFVNSHAGESKWQDLNNRLFQVFNACFVDYVSQFPFLQKHALDGEGFRFKHYRQHHGQFLAHIDQTPETPNRALAAILYLNDVTEGGETEFIDHDIKVEPKAGRILIAPCAWTHPHRANPPTSSDKYVINTFAVF